MKRFARVLVILSLVAGPALAEETATPPTTPVAPAPATPPPAAVNPAAGPSVVETAPEATGARRHRRRRGVRRGKHGKKLSHSGHRRRTRRHF